MKVSRGKCMINKAEPLDQNEREGGIEHKLKVHVKYISKLTFEFNNKWKLRHVSLRNF